LVENIIFHQRFLTFAWKLGGWTKPFSCSCAKSLRLTPWKCDLWQLGRDVCTGLFVPASRMGSGKHVEVRPSLAWTILRRYSALFHSPILGSLCQRSTGTPLRYLSWLPLQVWDTTVWLMRGCARRKPKNVCQNDIRCVRRNSLAFCQGCLIKLRRLKELFHCFIFEWTQHSGEDFLLFLPKHLFYMHCTFGPEHRP
jgi:hypothetical protein